MNTHIIAVTNQKGGVGKTTTAIHLAHALVLQERKIRALLVDLDPQGNATQGLGINLNTVETSIADLIRDRNFPKPRSIFSILAFKFVKFWWDWSRRPQTFKLQVVR